MILEIVKAKKNIFKKTIKKIKELIFYLKLKKYKNCRKIIYVITPPPNLKNIGDHAQVVAIKKWFKENFAEFKVFEFDKNQVYNYINSIRKITTPHDLIFLHSGGNLGDRGIWSEEARRKIIENFPKNKIISLPQTIFFSNTEKGKRELEKSKKIYNKHRKLTVIARDYHSYDLAKKYFKKCKVMVSPDFVLSLGNFKKKNDEKERDGVLLCFRNDVESSIKEEEKEKIKKYLEALGIEYREFDTTIKNKIPKNKREATLKSTLSFFAKHKLVITDRLHGVVFSIITETPCIALKTVDHKLVGAMKWFIDLEYVKFAKNPSEIYQYIPVLMKFKPKSKIDWKKKYFDDLKNKLLNP
mgnify:CR=1 FL=1